MSKYNKNKEKYLFLPTYTQATFFQYYWSKYLNFKLKLFGIPLCIGNLICLILSIFQAIFYAQIYIRDIVILSFLSSTMIIFSFVFLFILFSKNKTTIIEKIKTIFLIFYDFYSILFIISMALIPTNDDTFAIPFSILFPFALINLIISFILVFVLKAKLLIDFKYSKELESEFVLNLSENDNLISFKYVNEENNVWKKDEIIFQNENFVIKYFGIGVFKKNYEFNCLYIFKLNEKYIYIDFCSFSRIIVSKTNKQQLEKKIILDLLGN